MRTRLIVATAAVALAAACSSSSSSKVNTPAAGPAATTATSDTSGGGAYGGGKYGAPASPTTTATSGTAAGAGSGATVSVSGGHLVAPDGHTVYFFDKDSGTTSACTGGCASIWPGLVASGTPTGGTGVDASKLSTATGQVANQVVDNGHLLYEFSGDKAAGDTNGTKIPGWHDVPPTGGPAS